MFKLKATPLPEGTNNCDLHLLVQQMINHACLVRFKQGFSEKNHNKTRSYTQRGTFEANIMSYSGEIISFFVVFVGYNADYGGFL